MLPLTGLRVIAVEQYGAGPFGTQHLADQGAEVIKVEDPALGDASLVRSPQCLAFKLCAVAFSSRHVTPPRDSIALGQGVH